MRRDASAAMKATIRTSGRDMGAELRVLLTALLFLAATDVRCSITANAQALSSTPVPVVIIVRKSEGDALNAVLRKWTSGGLNQQLSSVLGWSLQEHPCFNKIAHHHFSDGPYKIDDYEGGWRGVVCSGFLTARNDTGNYYTVSVTGLNLFGSNMSCDIPRHSIEGFESANQCGFDGIQGVLPPDIGGLTNLDTLTFKNHPKLTGAVPLQIWQMPNLFRLQLVNNSLEGTLPCSSSLSSTLDTIDLSNNQFTGKLEVSLEGTLFSSSLRYLNLASNHMFGEVNFERLSLVGPQFVSLDLRHNNFNGTFSTGHYFNPWMILLSNNSFTRIKFSNYSGNESGQGFHNGSHKDVGIIYMPALQVFAASDNQLGGSFLLEIWLKSGLSSLDVSGNCFSGSLDFPNYPFVIDYEQLNFSRNQFNGSFSSSPYLNPRILDISHNQFKHINFNNDNETDVSMPMLEELYMGNNKATGEFPVHILKSPMLNALYADHNLYDVLRLPTIQYVNFFSFRYGHGISLTNNNIKAIIYPDDGGGVFSKYNLQFSNYLFLAGNPSCKNIDTILLSTICRVNQFDNRPLVNGLKGFSKKIKAIIVSSTSIFGLILLILSIYVWRLVRRLQSLGMILKEFDKREVKPNLYSYKDIKLATKNFDTRNKLGEGAFGVVYKGELADGTIVAVKKLTMSSSQILSEFLNEVVVISGLIHRNLVKLKGCCLGNGDQRILIFEYVENKNLAEALSFSDDKKESTEPMHLDWASRFNIIIGITRGLAYLHDDLQSPVIHRDIKATNILLDKDYNPKIADFGLACLFPTLKINQSHLTMDQVAGTRGYCAPEYALHGHMSTALDVYSFGILVLEIICGRKNIDLNRNEEEMILQEWAWKLFETQNSVALIDPRMNYSSLEVESIKRVINVALACVQFKAASRPKMRDIGHMLSGHMLVSEIHEHPGGVPISFNMDSGAISSWENNNVSTDELSLLSNALEIEMSGRSDKELNMLGTL